MSYILLIILAALLVFNIYASRAILRSTLNDESQKRMQILFVWLLPILGAVITLQVLKDSSRKSRLSGGLVGMQYDQAWDYHGHNDDCPPGADCGE